MKDEDRGKIVISNFFGGLLAFLLAATVGLGWGSSALVGAISYKLFSKLNYIAEYLKDV